MLSVGELCAKFRIRWVTLGVVKFAGGQKSGIFGVRDAAGKGPFW